MSNALDTNDAAFTLCPEGRTEPHCATQALSVKLPVETEEGGARWRPPLPVLPLQPDTAACLVEQNISSFFLWKALEEKFPSPCWVDEGSWRDQWHYVSQILHREFGSMNKTLESEMLAIRVRGHISQLRQARRS